MEVRGEVVDGEVVDRGVAYNSSGIFHNAASTTRLPQRHFSSSLPPLLLSSLTFSFSLLSAPPNPVAPVVVVFFFIDFFLFISRLIVSLDGGWM